MYIWVTYFSGIIQSILVVWGAVWWFVLPLIALLIFWEAWLLHLHCKWVTQHQMEVLEIKVPKNVLKTPKAMEQIFAAAHAPYSYGIPLVSKILEGQEEYWMVFELVGRAGETHFYLRVPPQFRNMMESAIYGHIPEAEITEAEDYLDELPHILPNESSTSPVRRGAARTELSSDPHLSRVRRSDGRAPHRYHRAAHGGDVQIEGRRTDVVSGGHQADGRGVPQGRGGER